MVYEALSTYSPNWDAIADVAFRAKMPRQDMRLPSSKSSTSSRQKLCMPLINAR